MLDFRGVNELIKVYEFETVVTNCRDGRRVYRYGGLWAIERSA